MFFIRGENMHENDATSCEIEVCEYIHAHEETVKLVKSVMPPDEQLYDLAELYKIFGDGTRIKILYVLFQGEMCVCDISTLLGAGQSAVSHQLKILRQADLVKPRREGKTVFYSLADDHVKTIISNGLDHILE
jgi:ArsR family transcriptional regulator